MLDTVKKITGFFGMSENPSENLRVFRLFYTFCSITHIVFLVTFIFMGITALSIASVLSVACYMICLSATYFKKYYYTILLAFLEIISFSILSVVYLGWDMNIQYFMICIIPLGFFFPFKRIECPLIATILAATLYVLLLIHSNKVEPLFNLENYQFVANTIKYTSLVTCLIGVILLSYLFSFSVRKKQAQLKHANKVLERIANTDALTGLANRRSMVKSLGVALRNLRTDSIPATVVIGDIDDFKQVNDTYGHDFGDVVLSNISKLMKINLENVGIVSRWGGEEFLILLENCTKNKANQIITDLCHKIANFNNICNGENLKITMTFGLSEIKSDSNIDIIISNADTKLYEGKNCGKNCVR